MTDRSVYLTSFSVSKTWRARRARLKQDTPSSSGRAAPLLAEPRFGAGPQPYTHYLSAVWFLVWFPLNGSRLQRAVKVSYGVRCFTAQTSVWSQFRVVDYTRIDSEGKKCP
uniref:Uncharacterized protein n=1 Tax=Timema cristinae TaxID=61476 RepID=A0A7R9CBQ2_TIMCR|nr:unnamed protein product [Timema cristinae]